MSHDVTSFMDESQHIITHTNKHAPWQRTSPGSRRHSADWSASPQGANRGPINYKIPHNDFRWPLSARLDISMANCYVLSKRLVSTKNDLHHSKRNACPCSEKRALSHQHWASSFLSSNTLQTSCTIYHRVTMHNCFKNTYSVQNLTIHKRSSQNGATMRWKCAREVRPRTSPLTCRLRFKLVGIARLQRTDRKQARLPTGSALNS